MIKELKIKEFKRSQTNTAGHLLIAIASEFVDIKNKLNEVIIKVNQIESRSMPVINLDDESKNCLRCLHEHAWAKACECGCIKFESGLPVMD